jgi:subtilisin-like proprotein convertase family protein
MEIVRMRDNDVPMEAEKYQAYLVRLWRSNVHGNWRASIQDAQSGEQHLFANMEDLFLFLHEQTTGKLSDPIHRTVVIDNVAPEIAITNANETVHVLISLVTDGVGLRSVVVHILFPDGSARTESIPVQSDEACQFTFPLGDCSLWLSATVQANNTA